MVLITLVSINLHVSHIDRIDQNSNQSLFIVTTSPRRKENISECQYLSYRINSIRRLGVKFYEGENIPGEEEEVGHLIQRGIKKTRKVKMP